MSAETNPEMRAAQAKMWDAVIVGSGIAGAMVAKRLAEAGKSVLLLEAGDGLPPNINAFMQRYFLSPAKVPESPYTPALFGADGRLADPSKLNAPRPTVLSLGKGQWTDPSQAYLVQKGENGDTPFSSTYERIAGGTVRHWLGTSLRNFPADFKMRSTYGPGAGPAFPAGLVDWPLGYAELSPWYCLAEQEIGVSANVDEQRYLCADPKDAFPPGYAYPMPGILPSLVDQAVAKAVDGMELDGVALKVSGTPAGRNSRPYQGRRVCAGNSNCIPICPIQAKYDPSVTLNRALATGNVTLLPNTVAAEIVVDCDGKALQINTVSYREPGGPVTGKGWVCGHVFIIAANAIETPSLLLRSTNGGRTPRGVANRSGQVGKNLMDHPMYLAWGRSKAPVYGYRGPISTSGIETARDGAFRRQRAAFRMDIGNDGWLFPGGDPFTSTVDLVNGSNHSGANPPAAALGTAAPPALFGKELAARLNGLLTRQFRLGFLVEQEPEASNAVTLSATETDHLGLPRPQVSYKLSDYTKRGFAAAKRTADAIFERMGAEQFTSTNPDRPSSVWVDLGANGGGGNGGDNGGGNGGDNGEGKGEGKAGLTQLNYFGAGHIMGTCRMGSSPTDSVVDADQRCWDSRNLFLVGSSTFPTGATANPTLTLAALALRTAEAILRKDLRGAG